MDYRYARVIDGVVLEVCAPPAPAAESFPANLAAQMVDAPAGIAIIQGDAFDGTRFIPGPAHIDAIRREQKARIDAVVWKWERHKQQLELGVTPSLSDAAYRSLLVYVQQLREIDASGALRIDEIAWPVRPEGI